MEPLAEEGSMGLNVKMLGHEQARNVDELWAGKTDIKERRKLQNRLNRRAYRKRQADLRQHQRRLDANAASLETRTRRRSQIPGVHVFALATEDRSNKGRSISLNDLVSCSDVSMFGSSTDHDVPCHPEHSPPTEPWCRPFEHSIPPVLLGAEATDLFPEPGMEAAMLEEGLIESGDMGMDFSVSSDHLISLIYYNVFRGLSNNIRALKLDMRLMGTRDYVSPFVTGGVDLSLLAPDFHPTLIQQTIPHHPCFDIFPDPVLRDNAIINWAADMPHGRLCLNLAGRKTWHEMELTARHGCMLWGPADNADSWEVTEGFAREWPFLVQGAYRLQAATNRWRGLRGESPISFA